MGRIGLRVSAVVTTVALAFASAAGTGRDRRPLRSASQKDLPLLVFQRIDNALTAVDTDNQALHMRWNRIGARTAVRERSMLRAAQRSPESRQRLRKVDQLLAVSANAERTYRTRNEPYGARLFHDLHTRVAALKRPVLQSQHARTAPDFDQDQKLIETRLLSVVMQFQAISGGYAALECHPGTWACCQPRIAKDGKSNVRGCSWSCAARLSACKGGCLGPHIPNMVVAVKTKVPRPGRRPQRDALAANRTRKPNSTTQAATRHQSTVSGSE